MSRTPTFAVGDLVECKHDDDWQQKHLWSDAAKAKKVDVQGQQMFMGNASAYMHLDEAYLVVRISSTGGLCLRGFMPKVSAKDVQLSTKPNYR